MLLRFLFVSLAATAGTSTSTAFTAHGFFQPSRPHNNQHQTSPSPLQMVPFVGEAMQAIQNFEPANIPSMLPELTLANVQAAGETTFASAVLIAGLQGALIMHSYANNPSGELISPPGLTIGIEDATGNAPLDSMVPERDDITTQKPSLVSMETTDESNAGWAQLNKYLVLLLPMLAGQASFALMRYGHIMHIGAMVGVARVYDFFRKLPQLQDDETNLLQEMPVLGDEHNIMVLGDSMAVGIGCVDEFEKDKNSGIMKRVERLELPPDAKDGDKPPVGPIFPRSLAQTLSKRLQKPVAWRSAGVDGGDTTDIREYLVGCVKEEADKGSPPDVVVVLTGANDLKRIISVFPNSKPCASVRGFRSDLLELVQDIQKISPKTKVVFPALPTYRLESNSCLNVFPLNFFLDALLGFWDSQKVHAAEKSQNVYYFGLEPEDVNGWYKKERQKGNMAPSLLSADGIHPNAQCYAKWGATIGDKLADTLVTEERTRQSQATNKDHKAPTTEERKPAFVMI